MSGANRKRCCDEFADRSPEWDVTVIDVESGFSLVDPTAPNQRENMRDQDSHDEACERRRCNESPGMGLRHWSEQPNLAPLNRQTETYNREP